MPPFDEQNLGKILLIYTLMKICFLKTYFHYAYMLGFSRVDFRRLIF